MMRDSAQSCPATTPKSAATDRPCPDGARLIPLTKGFVAIVDEADYGWLSQWKWCVNNQGYAVRSVRRHPLPQLMIYMHRVIHPSPTGMFTDHADRDRLDNRRANLRTASYTQSAANRTLKSAIGFRGVVARAAGWGARIKEPGPTGRLIRLGIFPTKEEAARAYDAAAAELYGDFAVLNFPEAA